MIPTAPVDAPATGTLLPFILKLSVAAAVALFAFSLWIQSMSLPSGEDLQASDRSWMFEPPPPPAQVREVEDSEPDGHDLVEGGGPEADRALEVEGPVER